MPNPSIIHPRSSKTHHFLGIADIYIRLNQPKIYTVEPQINDEYIPDFYTRLPDACIGEFQRSTISSKKLQEKVDQFCDAFKRKEHDAKTLLIVTDLRYSLKVPNGFNVIVKSLGELA